MIPVYCNTPLILSPGGRTQWSKLDIFRCRTQWSKLNIFRGRTQWSKLDIFRGRTQWSKLDIFRGRTQSSKLYIFEVGHSDLNYIYLEVGNSHLNYIYVINSLHLEIRVEHNYKSLIHFRDRTQYSLIHILIFFNSSSVSIAEFYSSIVNYEDY